MITSKPVTEARRDRGTGNKTLGGVGAGHCNPNLGRVQVYDDKLGWVTVNDTGRPKDKAYNRDYELARECDKVMGDYRRFKDPRDREKIKAELEGRQMAVRMKNEGKLLNMIMEGNDG